MHAEMETTFHDVNIHGATFYPGTSVRQPIMMTTRLELAARSSLLAELLAGLQLCDGCRDPVTIIIAEEEASTVAAVLGSSNTAVSIIQGRYLTVIIIIKTKIKFLYIAKIILNKPLTSQILTE